jgi:transposase
MSRDFDRVYAGTGRPSLPLERLVRASTVLYSIRSERSLCEQLDYNLLFSLVRGSVDRRAGVGSLHLHHQP